MIEEDAFKVIQTASKRLQGRTPDYTRSEDYYNGDHNLAFATETWLSTFGTIFQQLRDNLCPLVVDSLVSRLQINGFGVEASSLDSTNFPSVYQGKPIYPLPTKKPEDTDKSKERQYAADVWTYNRMDSKQTEVHEEAIKKGDGYVIVWPDPNGQACIYPNDAECIDIQYDTELPGTAKSAVKLWDFEGYLRANIYYPDRIEKYITVEKIKKNVKTVDAVKRPEDWDRFPVEDEEWPLPNPYDKVPVFHFRNRGKCGGFGMSELNNIIPIQDALNKSLMDLMVAAEFLGFPQRWMTGLAPEEDDETGQPKELPFRPGVDRLWALWGEQVKMGQFDAAELRPHLAVLNDLRTEIGRISQTPAHLLLLMTGTFPSGESLKVAEAPFTAKITKRQTDWGNVWEDVVAFCIFINTDQELVAQLSAEWENAQPRSTKEDAEQYFLWKQLGIPDRVIWRHMGFSESECDDMERMAEEQRQKQMEQQQEAQAATGAPNGSPVGGESRPGTPPALAPYGPRDSSPRRDKAR